MPRLLVGYSPVRSFVGRRVLCVCVCVCDTACCTSLDQDQGGLRLREWATGHVPSSSCERGRPVPVPPLQRSAHGGCVVVICSPPGPRMERICYLHARIEPGLQIAAAARRQTSPDEGGGRAVNERHLHHEPYQQLVNLVSVAGARFPARRWLGMGSSPHPTAFSRHAISEPNKLRLSKNARPASTLLRARNCFPMPHPGPNSGSSAPLPSSGCPCCLMGDAKGIAAWNAGASRAGPAGDPPREVSDPHIPRLLPGSIGARAIPSSFAPEQTPLTIDRRYHESVGGRERQRT